MKKFNYYYDKMPISIIAFLSKVPKNWEDEIVNGTYSYGYYRATVIEEENLSKTTPKTFVISGFWKDDKVKFSDRIVKESNLEDDDEDEIFYYGLSEEEIQEAIKLKWHTDLEFVITSYSATV